MDGRVYPRVYPRFVLGLYQNASDGEKTEVRANTEDFWVFWTSSDRLGPTPGGEGGIRTRDTLASMPHFECGAFNHSATSPKPSHLPLSL